MAVYAMGSVGGKAEVKNATQSCRIWLGGLSMNRQ